MTMLSIQRNLIPAVFVDIPEGTLFAPSRAGGCRHCPFALSRDPVL
jgi:hypothetical protein